MRYTASEYCSIRNKKINCNEALTAAFNCSFDDVCLDKAVGVMGNSSILAPAVVAPKVPALPGRSSITVDADVDPAVEEGGEGGGGAETEAEGAPAVALAGGAGGISAADAEAEAEATAAPTGFTAPTDFRYSTTEVKPICSAILNAVAPSYIRSLHTARYNTLSCYIM
jgi:hypothetical protein